MPSVALACNALNDSKNGVELQKILDSIRVDLDALKTSFNQLRTDYNANATIATDTTAAAVTLVTTP